MITFRTETILNQGIHDHTMRDRLGVCNTDKVCGAEMGAVVPVITLALVLYHDVGSVVATYLINLFWGDTYRELRIRECFIDDFLLSLVFFVGLLAHILLSITWILLESIFIKYYGSFYLNFLGYLFIKLILLKLEL